jgi:hypothetical protein
MQARTDIFYPLTYSSVPFFCTSARIGPKRDEEQASEQ